MKTVAIVGAGFSGTMLSVQLMEQATGPLRIYLIEKKAVARGQAYANIDPALLLNVRADHMGAYPDNVGHFYNWLQEKKIDSSPSDFIPRKIYGDYLTELLEKTRLKHSSLVDFVIINDQAMDVIPEEKLVKFKNQQSIVVDEIVLATGLESPTMLDLDDLTNQPLTIIGTGLSMIDTLVLLKKKNYTGKITAVSRRGKIPHPHKFFDKNVIRPILNFSKNNSLKAVYETVKENLKNYEWRLVIDAIRPHTPFLWQSWTIREKGQFLRYLRPYWDIHRHRISPEHLQLLNELVQNGQLEVKAIGFKPYHPQTDKVIHCEGLSYVHNIFIQNLLKRNLILSDDFKLGIQSKVTWIHTLGPLRRSELWESTAVPEIRIQAKELATNLLASL